MVTLSIVVVNYNSLKLLQGCLAHLDTWVRLPATEIIVVDNGSTDGSGEWVRKLDSQLYHVVLSQRNLGFAGGCNLGIRQSSGDYILLLNTDAFPQAGALDLLVEYLVHCPSVGVAGPQLLYPDGRWQRSTNLTPSPKSAMLDALGITSLGHVLASVLWKWTGRWWRPRPVEYVDGACMLIRRAVIDDIGGLDERFFFFVEDAEFCRRARQHGWQVVYVPQSQVVHLRGGSSSKKNAEESLRMRWRSEREFILRTWGEVAWRRFLFWRRLNYRWRLALATLCRDANRRQRYQVAWRVYAQESP